MLGRIADELGEPGQPAFADETVRRAPLRHRGLDQLRAPGPAPPARHRRVLRPPRRAGRTGRTYATGADVRPTACAHSRSTRPSSRRPGGIRVTAPRPPARPAARAGPSTPYGRRCGRRVATLVAASPRRAHSATSAAARQGCSTPTRRTGPVIALPRSSGPSTAPPGLSPAAGATGASCSPPARAARPGRRLRRGRVGTEERQLSGYRHRVARPARVPRRRDAACSSDGSRQVSSALAAYSSVEACLRHSRRPRRRTLVATPVGSALARSVSGRGCVRVAGTGRGSRRTGAATSAPPSTSGHPGIGDRRPAPSRSPAPPWRAAPAASAGLRRAWWAWPTSCCACWFSSVIVGPPRSSASQTWPAHSVGRRAAAAGRQQRQRRDGDPGRDALGGAAGVRHRTRRQSR